MLLNLALVKKVQLLHEFRLEATPNSPAASIIFFCDVRFWHLASFTAIALFRPHSDNSGQGRILARTGLSAYHQSGHHSQK